MKKSIKRKPIVLSYITLHVPCRYNYLRIIRHAVQDLCARAGLTELKAAQMEMAVDEACANTIEHGYGGETNMKKNPRHPGLYISLIQYNDRIVVELVDYAKRFNFKEQQPINPQDYISGQRQRGLGMYIIKNFVDEAAYERTPHEGNCLRLTKKVR